MPSIARTSPRATHKSQHELQCTYHDRRPLGTSIQTSPYASASPPSSLPTMAVAVVFNLIIAFTILTAILLVALFAYAVLFYLKRRRAQPGTDGDLEEAGDQAQADLLSRRLSRRLSQRQAQQVIYSEQQRMSTKTPPLQLLPEIETSDDRAIEWLEKGRCKEVRFDDEELA